MIINKAKNNIFTNAIIIMIVSIFAKIASFITETILAYKLGTGNDGDAFYVVSGIQQVIYPMISVGIWKIYLPLYKEKISKGLNIEANRLTNNIISIFSLVSIVVVSMLYLFSDNIVKLIAPGLDYENRELCSSMVKISSPMYLFIVVASIYATMLQCHNKFFGSQIREIVSHIPVAFFAILFFDKFGVKVLAIALILGGLFRLLVEIPFIDWNYSYRFICNFKDKDIIFFIRKLPSVLLSEGINQFNVFIDRIMASYLAVGSIAALNYGNKLTNAFSGFFSAAISTALYPQMIELISLNQKNKLNTLLVRIINIFSIIIVPISMSCYFFSIPIVSVVFERGAFLKDSVNMTAGIFANYCISLYFMASNTILLNIFYGYGDTNTPMFVSIFNMIVNLCGNLIFIEKFGLRGLALSTSVASIVVFAILSYKVNRIFKLNLRISHLVLLKVVATTFFFNICILHILDSLKNIYTIFLLIIIYIAAYIKILKMMHIDEIEFVNDLIVKVKRRFNK